jgi:polysaccharide pyruvyl transferase WcaK-like protein
MTRDIPVVNYRLSFRSHPREHLFCIVLFSLLYHLIPIAAFRSLIKRAIPWIRAVAEADFVGDIRGGDSFSDIYGMFPFLEAFGSILAVILVRGEIVQLPQTYGPFSRRASRAIARWILSRSSSILARDISSAKVLAPLLGIRSQDIIYCPDVAFILRADSPRGFATSGSRGQAAKITVGVNISGMMFNAGYCTKRNFGLTLDYRALIPELLIALLADSAVQVLLVPHTYGWVGSDSDSEGALRALDVLPRAVHSRVNVITANHDQHELKGIIGTCDFFIGSRMHACIAALSQAIPCVGIAYSHKFKGVFDSVGMADWVVDGRTTDNRTAVAKVMSLYQKKDIARPILHVRVKQAQAQLRNTFAQLLHATAREKQSHAQSVLIAA